MSARKNQSKFQNTACGLIFTQRDDEEKIILNLAFFTIFMNYIFLRVAVIDIDWIWIPFAVFINQQPLEKHDFNKFNGKKIKHYLKRPVIFRA